MPDLSAEVIVVGAGPAGSAAAIELARAGREVLVVDRARFPRDKHCGDGLTAAALVHLEELGLDPSAVPDWTPVTTCRVVSPSGRVVTLPLPPGPGWWSVVAPRFQLDAALLEVARGAGARIVDGARLVSAADRGDRIECVVDGLGVVSARYAVGADGMWSTLRRALGVHDPRFRGTWHAFRQYVRTEAPREQWVWFEPDLLPAYAWAFPVGADRANIGFGVRRGAKIAVGDMGRLWPELRRRPGIAAVLGEAVDLEPPRAWPIPARVDRTTLTAGRALFVGDAAAAADPMTGEGIAQALLTGRLAARSVVEAGPLDDARARSTYERAVRSGLVADHRMASLLTRALRHRKGARAAVRVAGLTPWTRRNFARWLFEDYPRALVVTPRRWRHHSLRGPGAYADRATAG